MSRYQLYLAPFQGITTDIFLEAYTRSFPGIEKLFTAFFAADFSGKKLKRPVHSMEQLHYNSVPVVPQILSKTSDEIILFGMFCKQFGYDEINWNMGCPYPRVANKKRGSGLLSHPDLVKEILDKTIPKLPIKLSIKCRLGYKEPHEILNLLPLFNDFPLSEIIIHARIGKQLYKGDVDLDSFSDALKNSKLPVAYNGDIFSSDSFIQRQTQFPQITSWMIGRGILTDPFLPADIKGIAVSHSRKEKIRRFVDDLYYGYRKEMNDRLQAINRMKELWSYLSFSFDNQGKVFGLIKKVKSFDEYEDAVNRVFDEYYWIGGGGKLLL